MKNNDKQPAHGRSANSDVTSEFGVSVSMEFGERLKVALSGESLHSFAKRAGIPDSTMRNYLAGTMPGLDNLLVIARTAGVTLDWLAAEMGPMRATVAGSALDASGLPAEFALLPRYSVSASAGQGLVAQEELEIERIAFRLDWLREIGLDPKQAGLLTAQGDSMHPAIPDGALMLVDRREAQPIRSGYIYVIVLDGEVLVKRVSRNTDKTIDLISDNPLYPIKNIPQTEFDGLFIAGRVFWVGRKI